MKILIVEDDKTLAENFKNILLKNNLIADLASSLEKGLTQTYVNEYDCLIVDINLPDGSGFDLISEIRKKEDKTPVIIVTARSQINDRVKGLNIGADDYISKPVDSNELIARIRAVIRRNSLTALPVIKMGKLTVHPSQQISYVDDKKLNLTSKEFAVLEYLAQNNNQVITRSMLMEHVWGSEFETFSNVVDVYIRNIRRKMEKEGLYNAIKTIRGKGYILSEK